MASLTFDAPFFTQGLAFLNTFSTLWKTPAVAAPIPTSNNVVVKFIR
ncbi:hypothetical protein [Clostridium lundense]|nr:hypothetical protein [Clostridium lundense]